MRKYKRKLFFCLSDDKTQRLNERGAWAFYSASFHSTVSVCVMMALNIYVREFTMTLRKHFQGIILWEREKREKNSLSKIDNEAGKAITVKL